jgi:hypothetical protein
MMLKKHLLSSLLYLLIFATYAQKTDSISNGISNEFHSLAKTYESESIYIKSNKGIYETKEDLWFKGYILNNKSLKPSLKSKIFFMQLIREVDSIAVWQEKYPIKNGFVDGHVYLQDSLTSGSYYLEGYTVNSAYQNQKEIKSIRKIQIIKKIDSLKNKVIFKEIASDKKIEFTMFPEGGKLVSGIESVLAFKANNTKGLPIKVSGYLYENNKRVLGFKTVHNGLGILTFTPDITKSYFIKLNDRFSKTKYALPKIHKKGKTLRLFPNSKTNLLFKVNQPKTEISETVYLRVQMNGKVYFVAKALIKDKVFFKIPIKEIPKGIVEATLLDKDFKPVAERLAFVNLDKKLTIKATLNKENYATKDKVTLKIEVKDQYKKPVKAHLGITVYDAIYKNKLDVKNINTHYYLSSHLKGNIFNPDYYFDEKNKNRKQAINLLLLTQGWRDYVWNEKVLKANETNPIKVLSEVINGRLIEKTESIDKLSSQKFIQYATPKNLKGFSIIFLDESNTFKILPKDLENASGMYLYLKLLPNKAQKKYQIKVYNDNFKKLNDFKETRNIEYPFTKLKKKDRIILMPFRVHDDFALYEVTFKAKLKRVFRDKYIGNLNDLIAGYICEHGFLNCKNHFSRTKPRPGQIYKKREGGIVVTKIYPNLKKDYTDEDLLKVFNVVGVKGYYKNKIFYEPSYTLEEQKNGLPDFRNTLLWKPNIITDKNGKAIVNFYCSDLDTKFLGEIEGLNYNGLLGSETFEFKVITKK